VKSVASNTDGSVKLVVNVVAAHAEVALGFHARRNKRVRFELYEV
jgi:hypothetical protein